MCTSWRSSITSSRNTGPLLGAGSVFGPALCRLCATKTHPHRPMVSWLAPPGYKTIPAEWPQRHRQARPRLPTAGSTGGPGESDFRRVELGRFWIDPDQKKAMWPEAVEQGPAKPLMGDGGPLSRFHGQSLRMPVAQTWWPSPAEAASAEIWGGTCSRPRRTIHAGVSGARLSGAGLTFRLRRSAEGRQRWAHEIYEIIFQERECVPMRHTVERAKC